MAPDLDDPDLLVRAFAAVDELRDLLLAYHDRSDGGAIVSLLEMGFASGAGMQVTLPRGVEPLAALF